MGEYHMKQWPDKLPEWATGASAAVTEPSSSKKELGWIVEKPPHQFQNWLQENTYDNLEMIKSILEPYSTLQELVEAYEYDPETDLTNLYVNARFLSDFNSKIEEETMTTLTDFSAVRIISADGRYICYASDVDTIEVINEKDKSSYRTITLDNTPSTQINDIASNGYYVAIAYDSRVEMYNLSDGSQEWAYLHDDTGSVEFVSLKNKVCYFGGSRSDGSQSTPVGNNFGVISDTGSLSYSIQMGNIGTVEHARCNDQNVWGVIGPGPSSILYYACIYDENNNLTTKTTEINLSSTVSMDSLADVVMTDKYIVIAGRDGAAERVAAFNYRGEEVLDSNYFDTGLTGVFLLKFDYLGGNKFLILAEDTTGTDSYVFGAEIAGSDNALNGSLLCFNWRLPITHSDNGRPGFINTDRHRFYLFMLNTGGTDPEKLGGYSLGRKPTHWHLALNQIADLAAVPVGG